MAGTAFDPGTNSNDLGNCANGRPGTEVSDRQPSQFTGSIHRVGTETAAASRDR